MDMFDLVFDGVAAFNQLGFLLGGLICLALALLLIGDYWYKRFTGRKVKGRITGIRAQGVQDPEKNVEPAEVKEAETYLESFQGGIRESFKKEPVKTVITGVFFIPLLCLPFMFFGFGAYYAYDYSALTLTGIDAPARIVDNEVSTDSDGSSYYAIVSFEDQYGYQRRVKDKIGTGGSPSFSVGERVSVFYEANDPEHFIIDDFWHYMLPAVMFMAIPLVFVGVIVLAANQQDKKRSKGEKPKMRHFQKEMYYPVYEYSAPDGSLHEINDDTGSNMLAGKKIGKEVTLYLSGDNPDNARKQGMIGLIFGAVFLVPGVMFTYLSFTQFDFTIMMPVLALAGIGWGAYKIKKSGVIKPRELWENRDQFQFRMKEKRKAKRAKGRLLTAAEIRERVQAYDSAMLKISIPIMSLIAVGLIVGGVYMYRDISHLSANGLRSAGEIVRIDSEYNSSSEGSSYTYYGVVEYRTGGGAKIEFRDNVGSSHPSFERGDTVDVIYDPQDPQGAIIDRGILNWALPVGLVMAGLLMLLGMIRSFLNILTRRKHIQAG